MRTAIKFCIINNELCLELSEKETLKKLVASLTQHGIHLFSRVEDLRAVIKPYYAGSDCGCFVSKQGRIGLAFPSEKLKFFFKEYLGLPSESFMDLGPGYDAQLHFSVKLFAFGDQHSLITYSEL